MDGLAVSVAFALGAIAGSFAAAVAWRVPRGISWIAGRSFCPHCSSQLCARDLVPVLSWLANKGKARCCGGKVSWHYALVEIAGAFSFAITILAVGFRPEVVPLFMLWTFLMVISTVDFSHRYIPDFAVAGVLVVGSVSDSLGMFTQIWNGLIAGGIVAAVIMPVRYLVGRLTGREALGLGDVKLFIAAGPWVGTDGMPILVFASSGVALLLYPLWRRCGGGTEMPFGPAIAFALYGLVCALT